MTNKHFVTSTTLKWSWKYGTPRWSWNNVFKGRLLKVQLVFQIYFSRNKFVDMMSACESNCRPNCFPSSARARHRLHLLLQCCLKSCRIPWSWHDLLRTNLLERHRLVPPACASPVSLANGGTANSFITPDPKQVTASLSTLSCPVRDGSSFPSQCRLTVSGVWGKNVFLISLVISSRYCLRASLTDSLFSVRWRGS